MSLADCVMFAAQNELLETLKNPRAKTIEGVIAIGGELRSQVLVQAYNHGIFPWPHEGYPLLWFCPDERGVIDLADLHLPKSFQKWLKKNRSFFTITMNQKFSEVIKNCKEQKRKSQNGTWITKDIENSYIELHQQGVALSLEVMRGDILVGGIYGVLSNKYFSCESMFHKEDNTSKLALFALIQHLQSLGYSWIDIQMVSSVCERVGGKLISKNDFLRRIGL